MRTKKTLIILISGLAGAGKTTVSEILINKLNSSYLELEVERYSFANPIKFMAQAYIGWNKEKDGKGRKLLQDIGKIGREYNEDIWVKHLLTQLDKRFNNKNQLFPTNMVIVDDWRFPNELAYLKENPLLDVITIRVFGRGGLLGDTANDVSETSLPAVTHEAIPTGLEGDHWYDFQIENSGEIELLNSKLDLVLAEVRKQYIVE